MNPMLASFENEPAIRALGPELDRLPDHDDAAVGVLILSKHAEFGALMNGMLDRESKSLRAHMPADYSLPQIRRCRELAIQIAWLGATNDEAGRAKIARAILGQDNDGSPDQLRQLENRAKGQYPSTPAARVTVGAQFQP